MTGSKRLPADWWSEFTHELLSRIGEACVVELVSADGQSRLGGGYPTYYTSDPDYPTSTIQSIVDRAKATVASQLQHQRDVVPVGTVDWKPSHSCSSNQVLPWMKSSVGRQPCISS